VLRAACRYLAQAGTGLSRTESVVVLAAAVAELDRIRQTAA
jgi:hypothetical protein